MTNEERLVLPGDELAFAEEFAAGEGTYESGGKVFASVMGEAIRDTKDRTISVKTANPIVLLSMGDEVICKVRSLKSSMAIVEIVKVVGKVRQVSRLDEGAIHISKISKDYVEGIDTEFDAMDVIKARVIQVSPSVQLSTVDKEYGVIHAKCSACGQDLHLKGKDLYCKYCDRVERRKLASTFGMGEGNLVE